MDNLLDPGKCNHERQVFLGIQDCGPGAPKLDLYNCMDYGTTLARRQETMSNLIAEARLYIELAASSTNDTDRYTYLSHAAELLAQIEYLD